MHVRAVAVKHDGELVARRELLQHLPEAQSHHVEWSAIHRAGLVYNGDEIERLTMPALRIDAGREAESDQIFCVRLRDEICGRRFRRETEKLPAPIGCGQLDVVLAQQPFSSDVIRLRNASAVHFTAKEVDVFGASRSNL